MKSYQERLDLIMEAIRATDEFKRENHYTAKFGEFSVGYYDASTKGHLYFLIKHGGIVVNRQQTGFCITWDTFELHRKWSFDSWLSEIENKVFKGYMTIEGKKFALVSIDAQPETAVAS